MIGRFFGLHKINQTAFVVMENVFQTNIPIHRVYDLKGSTVNRSTVQGESVQKDMDLNQYCFLPP
jgi:1-phosphatidylinositol-4-phosphate 5-kinase